MGTSNTFTTYIKVKFADWKNYKSISTAANEAPAQG
jgi:hypothetical protein